MLKFFLTIFSSMICGLFALTIDSNDSAKTVINLKELDGSYTETGRERSLFFPVSAVLNHSDNLIEIEFNEVCSGEIYVVDSNNNIVDSISVPYGMKDLVMPAPTTKGIYFIIIYCSVYHGEGYFCI